MPREVLGTSRGLLFPLKVLEKRQLVTFSPSFLSALQRTPNPPETALFSQVLGLLEHFGEFFYMRIFIGQHWKRHYSSLVHVNFHWKSVFHRKTHSLLLLDCICY